MKYFRCPLSCGDCCHDDDECRGLPLNDALCSSFAHIRKKCPSTCGTCDIEKNMGNHSNISTPIRLIKIIKKYKDDNVDMN